MLRILLIGLSFWREKDVANRAGIAFDSPVSVDFFDPEFLFEPIDPLRIRSWAARVAFVTRTRFDENGVALEPLLKFNLILIFGLFCPATASGENEHEDRHQLSLGHRFSPKIAEPMVPQREGARKG